MPTRGLHNQSDERDLLLQIAAGNEQAFRRFFDTYRGRLFVFVEQLVHSKADAEEIVQDVFTKVWQQATMLSEIEHLSQYVYVIARNKTLNYMRKTSRDKQLIAEAWAKQQVMDDSLEEQLRTSEAHELIRRAVSTLSHQKQIIFTLSRDKGLSHEEIALQLGLSKSRVKNLMVETLKWIKAYLARHSDLLALIFWIESGRKLF